MWYCVSVSFHVLLTQFLKLLINATVLGTDEPITHPQDSFPGLHSGHETYLKSVPKKTYTNFSFTELKTADSKK